mgnify:CR=1 FL=1
MTRPLKIAVADDEPDMREYFEKILPHMGHEVVAVCEDGKQLVEQAQATHPDLIITDIKMPKLDGIEAANIIAAECPLPVILVSGYLDPELIRRAEDDHVLAYLVKPIKRNDLEASIAIAMRRFEQFQQLRSESTNLAQAYEDRRLIERAKSALMKLGNLDEQSAFVRLQKIAIQKQLRLVDVARSVLLTAEVIAPPASIPPASRLS